MYTVSVGTFYTALHPQKTMILTLSPYCDDQSGDAVWGNNHFVVSIVLEGRCSAFQTTDHTLDFCLTVHHQLGKVIQMNQLDASMIY